MALIKFEGKPLEKLIDVVSSMIGVLYEPRKIRKNSDAEAYRMEKIAEAEAKGMIIKANAESQLYERAFARQNTLAIERQINLEQIAGLAISHLPESVSGSRVDKDWRQRFANLAQDVSNIELQEIWAKILSEEISNPESVSLRTLNVVSSLTKEECEYFQKYASLSFDGVGIATLMNTSLYLKHGLTYTQLRLLQSAGLISGAIYQTLSVKYREEVGGSVIRFGDKAYSFSYGRNQAVEFQFVPLSDEGQQLMSILNMAKDESYLNDFFNLCKSMGVAVETLTEEEKKLMEEKYGI